MSSRPRPDDALKIERGERESPPAHVPGLSTIDEIYRFGSRRAALRSQPFHSGDVGGMMKPTVQPMYWSLVYFPDIAMDSWDDIRRYDPTFELILRRSLG